MAEQGNRPVPDEILELAESLRAAVSRFVRSVRSRSQTPTTAQSETLALLEQHGSLSISEAAVLRHVKHQSMRLVIADLEASGAVTRRANPTDGRSQIVTLTEAGRSMLAQSRSARMRSISRAMEERLSSEERRTLREAIEILERLS